MDVKRQLLISRRIMLVLTVGVPSLFYWANRRATAWLEELQARGISTTAQITHYSRAKGTTFVHFTYEVNGVRYDYDRDERRVYQGTPFRVLYLPEKPSRPWAGPPITAEIIKEETAIGRNAIPITLSVFGLGLVLSEVQIRRRRGVADAVPLSPSFSPRVSATIMFSLVLTILVGVNFMSDVRAVQEKAFGPRPFGFPNQVVITTIEVFLYIPYYWVFLHLMLLLAQGARDGAIRGKIGIMLYVARVGRLHPEFRRSQTIVLAGIVYLLVLFTIWIAWTTFLRI